MLFGTVESVEDGSLIIEVSEPVPTNEEKEILWWEYKPGLDKDNRTTTVFIEPNTDIQMQDGDLTNLKSNAKIMIIGTWLGNGITADFIVDLRVMERAMTESQLAPLQAEGEWRDAAPEAWPAYFNAMPEIERPSDPGGELLRSSASVDNLQNIEFTGQFGQPAWAWSSGSLNFYWPIIPPIRYARIKKVAVLAGLGGGEYNFPFNFEAVASDGLIVDSTRSVSIGIYPVSPPDDEFSYYWAFGLTFHMKFVLHWLTWTGWHHKTVYWNIGILSSASVTRGPAPMSGDTLRIEDWTCPGITIEHIFELGVCISKRLCGKDFSAEVSIQDSVYNSCQPGDSVYPVYAVRPTTNPLQIDMSDLYYSAFLQTGFSFMFGLGPWTIFQSPVFWGMGDSVHFIHPDYYMGCDEEGVILDNWQTCGDQEFHVELELPVVPVVTSLTTPESMYRYGDLVTLNALVRGANGPGSSPKEVSFYDGSQFLSTEPIDAEDVATYQTMALNPCKHVIRAEYIGYDGQGNIYPSDKDRSLIVTGDAETARTETYWHSLYNGKFAFEEGRRECYLDIVDHISTVFNEVRDVSTVERACAVLSPDQGSAVDRFDRELLVWWLNFCHGGILYDQTIDYDLDGSPDPEWPFSVLMSTVEEARLDPGSTEHELDEWAQLLHDILFSMKNGAISFK